VPFSWPLSSYSRDVVKRLSLKTVPVLEPMTVTDAKAHLKVEDDEEDALIEALVAAARSHAERITGRQLITAVWTLKLDRFPCGEIEIPVAPLLTVVSVKYRDPDDVLTVWPTTEYVVDAPAGPYATTGRVYLAHKKEYPTTACRPDAVEIEFTAGYGADPTTIPLEIRQALLLLMGHWYENRETVNIGNITSELPFAAEALLAPFVRLAGVIR